MTFLIIALIILLILHVSIGMVITFLSTKMWELSMDKPVSTKLKVSTIFGWPFYMVSGLRIIYKHKGEFK
jgi:energy-converting hydrogenase Eha subunit A